MGAESQKTREKGVLWRKGGKECLFIGNEGGVWEKINWQKRKANNRECLMGGVGRDKKEKASPLS